MESRGSVSVWRMPPTLSQSRLGGRSSPSNACTVIAVRMAEIIHRSNTWMPFAIPKTKVFHKEYQRAHRPPRAAAGHEIVGGPWCSRFSDDTRRDVVKAAEKGRVCPAQVVSCLINAILDGNSIHEEAVQRRMSGEQNFTIPDAIHACRNSVIEVDFCSVPGPLSSELPFYFHAAIKSAQLSQDPRLFFLLIAFERTVMVVFERATSSLTLFDSHMHGQSDGAVIATGHVDNIEDFCQWLSNKIFHETQSQRERDNNREFEISLIRFCGKASSSDCCLPQAGPSCQFPVFATARRRRKRRLDTKTALRILKHAKKVDEHVENPEGMHSSSCVPRQQAVIPLASLSSLRSRNNF